MRHVYTQSRDNGGVIPLAIQEETRIFQYYFSILNCDWLLFQDGQTLSQSPSSLSLSGSELQLM